MSKKRILIIGKSPLVLETTTKLLQERGYKVDTTDNFDDITKRFDLRRFDLITTGGQVPEEKRAEIRKDAREQKHEMLFVQGLAGIPGLIVQQIEGEFAATYQDQKNIPIYDRDTRQIIIKLTKQAEVKITAWWQTTFVPPNPGSDSRVLLDEQLGAGEHLVDVPTVVPEKASFVTVQLDKAIYNFSLMQSK